MVRSRRLNNLPAQFVVVVVVTVVEVVEVVGDVMAMVVVVVVGAGDGELGSAVTMIEFCAATESKEPITSGTVRLTVFGMVTGM